MIVDDEDWERFKPYTDNGVEIDAQFHVRKQHSDWFELVVESRGGGRSSPEKLKNPMYSMGLDCVLKRLSFTGAQILEIRLDSRNKNIELGNVRLVAPEYMPIKLDASTDAQALRLKIGRLSAVVGSKNPKKGNYTRRLRFIIEVPFDVNLEDLIYLLRIGQNGVANSIISHGPYSDFDHSEAGSRSKSEVWRVLRRRQVAAAALREAGGRCEVCGDLAPFQDVNGNPFLEVHHVVPLACGGVDSFENVVACCPNCHRRMHYGRDAEDLKQLLYNRVRRLRPGPARNSTAQIPSPAAPSPVSAGAPSA